MLLTLLSLLSALAAEPPPVDPVVARVQTVEILASEFAAAARKAKPADGKALTEAERRAVLDGLIDDKLIWLEAKKSEAALAHPAVEKALVAAYLSEVTAASVGEPTEAELRAFYDANQALFVNPAVVRGSRILVAVGPKVTAEQAKARAQALHAAVKDNPKKTFAATAKKSSADVNKAEGGDMGLVTRNDKRVDDTVRKVLWSTKIGKVSEVFMTREGANIVWAAGRREQGMKTFEQAQRDVLKRWKAAKLVEARDAKVAKLEKASRVRVDDAALAAVPLPSRAVAPAKGKAAGVKGGGKPAVAKAPPAPVDEPEEDEADDDVDDGSED